MQADLFAHAPNLPLFALGQHKAQLLRVLPIHPRGLQGLAIQAQAVPQAGQQLRGKGALHIGLRCAVVHPHQVLFFGVAVFANQLAGNAAVLGQHQQADRVDVQPPSGGQASQLARRETGARGVVAPVVARLDQGDGRGVAVFGLPADIAHRLVQQNGDALGLLLLRLALDGDAVLRRHLHAHAGGLAVDAHPAVRDPVIGFAARAQAQFGHALVQTLGGVVHDAGQCTQALTGCAGRRRCAALPGAAPASRRTQSGSSQLLAMYSAPCSPVAATGPPGKPALAG